MITISQLNRYPLVHGIIDRDASALQILSNFCEAYDRRPESTIDFVEFLLVEKSKGQTRVEVREGEFHPDTLHILAYDTDPLAEAFLECFLKGCTGRGSCEKEKKNYFYWEW